MGRAAYADVSESYQRPRPKKPSSARTRTTIRMIIKRLMRVPSFRLAGSGTVERRNRLRPSRLRSSRRVQLLLAADDARAPTQRLVEVLRAAGHHVRVARVRTEAELGVAAGAVDAAIVDPDDAPLGGLRERAPGAQVIAWLPAPSSSRVADLLEAGVHEVVHSGMGDRELVARIAAAAGVDGAARVVEVGALKIDHEAGEATWRDERLSLTPRERDVLRVLAGARGKTVRREAIYRSVWGYAMPRGDRSVDVNVKRLRDKLAAGAPGLVVETEPAVGYRLVTDL
jgi:DNA-binding response OmpR family regulator